MLSHVLAVFTAAIGTFVLGALWYSPVLFGKQWMKAHGYTPEKLESMKTSMARTYAISFVCYLVMAAVLTVLLSRMDIHSVLGGVHIGALCWLGFVATVGLTSNLFSDKPIAAYVIDAGYQLVYLAFMGGLLAVWR